ncbi:MAG TPA: NAD(P)-binding domain-containing protein [Candidatus Limnocylindria bacterium]|nr:NAD(P)-binding domain-containing protein [Candidatus Limnocylindria bacterium]
MRPPEELQTMNIAIIGTGNVGSGLATAFVRAGHRVALAARTPEQVEAAAAASGATAATSPAAAAAIGDVVVLAVPFSAAEGIAAAIAPIVNGKPVVDVTNPAKPDSSGPLFAGTDSGAERIAAWLPAAHVVKAFNTLLAGNIADPELSGIALDGYVAADDAEAKALVLELVASIGLNPIDAGPLTAARMLEQLAWLNISLNMQPGWTWRTGWKLVGAPELVAARAA